MFYCWGEEDERNGSKQQGLIVASFHDGRMEIANVVFTMSSEILFPVPRSLYTAPPQVLAVMTNSARNKLTSVLPEYTAVQVQMNPCTSAVNCMYKGGKELLHITKQPNGDWVVDVAVSDECPRRAFASSSDTFSGNIVAVTNEVNLDTLVPDKRYKGLLKLVVYYDMLEQLVEEGIKKFVEAQQQFKQAGTACYTFLLCKVYETDEPEDDSVVYNAPWQTVKRVVSLTTDQVGEVPDEEEFLASKKAKELEKKNKEAESTVRQMRKKELEMAPPIPFAPPVWNARYDEAAQQAELDRSNEQMIAHSLDFSIPISAVLKPASIEQIRRGVRDAAAREKALKMRARAN